MSGDHSDPPAARTRTIAGVSAAGLLAVLCCAAPALITAGALGAVGSWLVDPWFLGGAAGVLLAATGWALRRRARSTDPGCCPPGHHATCAARKPEHADPPGDSATTPQRHES